MSIVDVGNEGYLLDRVETLEARVKELEADPRMALTIGDLRLLLTWAPSRSPEAARLRAALAGEGDEDE